MAKYVTSKEAREKLRKELEAKGLELAPVSRAIGREDSYLHHFIKYKRPRAMGEEERILLERKFGIDVSELKPPIESMAGEVVVPLITSQNSTHPRVGDTIQEAREAVLIDFWRKLSEDDQDIFMTVIRSIALPLWSRSRK